MTRKESHGPWEDAGQRIATSLEGFNAIVVFGEIADEAASVALGIARALTARRRVVVIDLAGTGAIDDLSTADDAIGVQEAFATGASLDRIPRPVNGSGRLETVPLGIGFADLDSVAESARWGALARATRKEGAMLLVVAEWTFPALGALIRQLDGAVLVGRARLEPSPDFLILRRVAQPSAVRPSSAFEAPRSRFSIVLVVATLALFSVVGGWMAWRAQRADTLRATPVPAPPPVAARAGPVEPVPVNPGDSAVAAAFAVEILSANTPDGANFELRRNRALLPAGTVSPISVGADTAVWYKVRAGAYTEASQADSLLRFMRSRGVVGDSAGAVVRAPFALLVDSAAAVDVTRALEQYRGRGITLYALRQSDGSARLYSGAFERGSEARRLADQMQAAGLTPRLAYRTGSVF